MEYGAYADCEDDLGAIPGKVGEDADGKRRGKGKLHLEGKPYSAEEIGYDSCEDHSGCGKKAILGKSLYEYPGQYGHEDEAQKVSAGRTGNLGGTAGESGEYRQACGAKQQVDNIAGHGVFPAKHIYADQQYQIREGDRYGTDRYRDGERRENAGDGCEHRGQNKPVRGQSVRGAWFVGHIGGCEVFHV